MRYLKYKDAKVGMRVRLNLGCSGTIAIVNATIIKTKHPSRPRTIQVLRDDGKEGIGEEHNGMNLWLCEADEAGYLRESDRWGFIINLIGGLIECSHCGLETYTDIKCTYCGYYNEGGKNET